MREKLFTLTRSQRDGLERRYKQTAERRIADRLQAILLLDAGHNRDQVARILRVNAKTITRWVQLFVCADLDTFCTLQSGGNDAVLTDVQQQQFAAWLDEQVRSTKEAIWGSRRLLKSVTPKVVCGSYSNAWTTATNNRYKCRPKPILLPKRRGSNATSKKGAHKREGQSILSGCGPSPA